MTKLQVSAAGSTIRVEVQVARMVVVMVLAFLVSWLPYAAMSLVVIMNSSVYIDPVIATIPVYLAKSSNVYNPIIYIFMNKQVILHHIHFHSQNPIERNIQTMVNPNLSVLFMYVCVQFRRYAAHTVLCVWKPLASDPQVSEWETTVASLNKSQKVLPKASLK